MALETYRRKRDFARTSEPEGESGTAAPSGRRLFTIQKHGARRLHYDLRLEHDGVLWSWAVTRGPSVVPEEKRLAVRTEDHPLEYATFEGVIPRGQYGAGPVLLWDRGNWTPCGDAVRGERKGHLELVLEGERLRGRWHLVRMAAQAKERTENWLLIKAQDEHARAPEAADILEEHDTSVLSGRTLEEIEAGAPAKQRRSRKPGNRPRGDDPFPPFVPPALATLRDTAPGGEQWLHEIKFDGYRLQARLRNGEAELLTRSGRDWTGRFGTAIPRALARIGDAMVLDGECVVEDAGGVSDFSALQADLAEERTDRFVFYAFDLLYLDGCDLRALPLVKRKAKLEALLKDAPTPIRYSAHFEEEGEVLLRHACRLSLEGLVSKRRDDPYPSGRTRSWIKSKCLNRQEFVILGYLRSSVSPEAVGALLLGQHGDEGEFVPVGRVGTGFSRKVAERLLARLEPLRRDAPELAKRLDPAARKGLTFVEPVLVAEVEFLAWTRDDTLRHASFRGLREDKPPEEVRAERPTRTRPAAAAVERPPVERPAEFDRLTHPDRIYWPETGVTKEGLAEYYLAVWRRLAPHLLRRPLALLRCPNGYTAQCFFQKHAWRGQSRHILSLADPLDDSDDPSMLAIDSLPGLAGLVQAGTLEIHTWQSTADDLERPDQIVMDLDPGEDVAPQALVAAAREVRERLAAAGLASFLKTSGGKGFHVVAPLAPRGDWAAVKGFAKGIADAMAADAPAAYVATIRKAKRKGRILIDYLRNGRGATAVAPYSTRARTGAPVSMPIAWDELSPTLSPAHFTVQNALARLETLNTDPWADFRDAAAPLPNQEGDGQARKRPRQARGTARR